MGIADIDFSQIEIREIGSWPLLLRIATVIAACCLSVVLVYYLLLKSQMENLDVERMEQEKQRAEFKEKYGLAANLPDYEKQMSEIKDKYKDMLRQLPSSSHVPELIDSITKLAEVSDLKFESIKLGDAKSVLGFYKELPIDLSVIGAYHSFGKFVSDVSKLPRIVTLGDFTIKPAEANNQTSANTTVLSMKIQAKTYWLSEEQIAPANAKTGKSAAKGANPPKQGAPTAPPKGSVAPKPSGGKPSALAPSADALEGD